MWNDCKYWGIRNTKIATLMSISSLVVNITFARVFKKGE